MVATMTLGQLTLWLCGQGYEDHLTHTEDSVPEAERPRWKKIDAQLCSIIKSTINPSQRQIFRFHITCAAVWEQAKALYTNATQRLYNVGKDLVDTIASKRIDGSMADYLGKVHGLLHAYNELLPPASTPAQEIENRQSFFMLLALHGLPAEYSLVRDQILGSPIIPTLNSAWSTLLRIPAKSSVDVEVSSATVDSSALISQSGERGRYRKPSRSRPKCDHCHKLGHTIDKCFALHGRPSRTTTTHTAQVASAPTESPMPAIAPPTFPAMFNDFAKWFEERQNSNSTASVAHTGNSFAGISHSSSLGPWVLDSGATDHITGNESLLSSLSTSGYLPCVTMANGSQIQSQGLGTANPLPSLSLDNVLYIPGSPFNLLSISRLTSSLDCIIFFTKESVFLQDRSSGRTIGIGCESQGLYRLNTSALAGSVVDSSLLIHAQLGHPGLAKLQQLVPSLSKLSSLSCESCQFGKHIRSSFPSRVNRRAASPFTLVHSDVWGPSRTVSTLGSTYFVTFIDDHSRKVWAFVLKMKD